MNDPTKTKTKKPGRRRRNKKDVILDFRKTTRNKRGQGDVAPPLDTSKNNGQKESRRKKGKIVITTGDNERVVQREFETTGQFFRRIDRMVAKARVEANLETRFDMNLPKKSLESQ